MLEQIEMGARQAGVKFEVVPAAPKMTPDEIESAVTKLLREELARLDEDRPDEDKIPPKR